MIPQCKIDLLFPNGQYKYSKISLMSNSTIDEGGEESNGKWLLLKSRAFFLQKGLLSHPEYFQEPKSGLLTNDFH